MLWEQLVTDGHVRAARLRAVAPVSAVVGVLLTAIGFYVLVSYVWAVPISEMFAYNSDPASVLDQRAMTYGQAPAQVFASQSQPNIPPDAWHTLAPQKQLPAVYKDIADSLKATDNPPTNVAIETAKSSDDFWSWNWPQDKIFYLNKGDLRAFGVVVQSEAASPGNDVFSQYNNGQQPVRWLAIFRKTSTGWADVAITGNGFVAPPHEQTASPNQIPVSLRTLMSIPDTSP